MLEDHRADAVLAVCPSNLLHLHSPSVWRPRKKLNATASRRVRVTQWTISSAQRQTSASQDATAPLIWWKTLMETASTELHAPVMMIALTATTCLERSITRSVGNVEYPIPACAQKTAQSAQIIVQQKTIAPMALYRSIWKRVDAVVAQPMLPSQLQHQCSQ